MKSGLLHVFPIILTVAIGTGCLPAKKGKEAAQPSSRPPLADESCDYSESEWNAWLNREMGVFRSRAFQINGPHIYTVLERCASEIEKFPKFSERTANLRRFTRRLWLLLQDNHTMGLQLTDAEYFSRAENQGADDIPEELKDQTFLKAVDEASGSDQTAAIEWLKKANEKRPESQRYIAFYYRSQHLTTVDDSQAFGRLFIFAPGENIDRFIQFGIRDDLSKPQPNGVSLISMVKGFPTPEGKQSAASYYNDLWRIRSNSGIAFSTRLKQTKRLESCYGCHSSALLPIVPEPASVNQERDALALKKVSSVMSAYALASQPHMDAEDFGPAMGPITSKVRTDDFIRKCSSSDGQAEIDIKKVKAAMSCASCHNDKNRRALRFPMAGFRQLAKDSLIKQFVQEFKTMPPSVELSHTERVAVAKCLSAEYLGSSDTPGIMERWLMNEETDD